ncbi:MAG: radical SAM protein [Geobacter sp.]|nr:radical SAM protein [Geobacter sp.]
MIVPFFIAHQGCPHQCVFCDQRTISGDNGELPSASAILSTIEAYRSSADGVVEVAFYGGTFTCLARKEQESLLAPLQPLLQRGDVTSVRISTRPDAVSGEDATFLASRGVRTVELGVQSLDDAVLDAAGRGHTAGDTVLACRTLKTAGLCVGLQLMPGLPGASWQSDLDSFAAALRLDPSFLRIYPTVVLAGTPLAALFLSGSYRPLSLDRAVRLCAFMLLAARRAGVPVIRMGLQASDSLAQPDAVLAGPYHPAFRQLVEGELWFALLCQMVAGRETGGIVSVSCAPKRVSDVAGQRRMNLDRLAVAYGITIERIVPDAGLFSHELVMTSQRGEWRADLLRDLNYTCERNDHVS